MVECEGIMFIDITASYSLLFTVWKCKLIVNILMSEGRNDENYVP